jgi:hypothetical protein
LSRGVSPTWSARADSAGQICQRFQGRDVCLLTSINRYGTLAVYLEITFGTFDSQTRATVPGFARRITIEIDNAQAGIETGPLF